jgi:TetR/AcrR family transcriptional repressor of nem operon
MARVSKEEALRTRATIVETSSRLFRERGLDGTSIADLMSASGLTHGGFYGHFPSKDALAAEACTEAFSISRGRWQKKVAATNASSKQAIVDAYLSNRSRDRSGDGCPTPSLAGDVARAPRDAAVRSAFSAGVQDLVRILASTEGRGDAATDRREALADYATMVGAMVLARATAGQPISEELLVAARQRLNETPPHAALQHAPPSVRRSRKT